MKEGIEPLIVSPFIQKVINKLPIDNQERINIAQEVNINTNTYTSYIVHYKLFIIKNGEFIAWGQYNHTIAYTYKST